MTYLKNNKDSEIYARDIRESLNIGKTQVSHYLKKLEKMHYIIRENKKNNKEKTIILTKYGLDDFHSKVLTQDEILILKAVKYASSQGV